MLFSSKSAKIAKLENELKSKIDMHDVAIQTFKYEIDQKNSQLFDAIKNNNEHLQEKAKMQFEIEKLNICIKIFK